MTVDMAKVANPDRIQIEHQPNRAVVVRSLYPDSLRRKAMIVLAVVCIVLGLVPVVVWLQFRGSTNGKFATLASAFFAVSIMQNLVRQFAAKTRSCVLRADQAGLTIESSDWRRKATRHFHRGQLDDIVLGFGRHGRPNGLFGSWLVIKSPLCRDIRCLHNAGGDHLARAADALRAALGMPSRSWP